MKWQTTYSKTCSLSSLSQQYLPLSIVELKTKHLLIYLMKSKESFREVKNE